MNHNSLVKYYKLKYDCWCLIQFFFCKGYTENMMMHNKQKKLHQWEEINWPLKMPDFFLHCKNKTPII